MPVNINDFISKVNSQVGGVSGALFRVVPNADGSLQIQRTPSAASGVWSVLYSRVIYSFETDVVAIGDGSGMTTESAQAFLNGLN